MRLNVQNEAVRTEFNLRSPRPPGPAEPPLHQGGGGVGILADHGRNLLDHRPALTASSFISIASSNGSLADASAASSSAQGAGHLPLFLLRRAPAPTPAASGRGLANHHRCHEQAHHRQRAQRDFAGMPADKPQTPARWRMRSEASSATEFHRRKCRMPLVRRSQTHELATCSRMIKDSSSISGLSWAYVGGLRGPVAGLEGTGDVAERHGRRAPWPSRRRRACAWTCGSGDGHGEGVSLFSCCCAPDAPPPPAVAERIAVLLITPGSPPAWLPEEVVSVSEVDFVVF